jgi:hypothetical protein
VDHLRSENEELENGLRLSAEEIERLQKRIMYLDARRDELKEQVRRRHLKIDYRPLKIDCRPSVASPPAPTPPFGVGEGVDRDREDDGGGGGGGGGGDDDDDEHDDDDDGGGGGLVVGPSTLEATRVAVEGRLC